MRAVGTSLAALAVFFYATAYARECKHGVYIVGISSTRGFEESNAHRGWAILVSSKKYYDSSAEFLRTDKGYRVDQDKARGKSLLDLAMYAMNMGYQVNVIDNNPRACDDFDELDVRRTNR